MNDAFAPTSAATDAVPDPLELPRAVAQRLRDRLRHAILGRDEVIDLVLTALLADGHVLLEDYPGSARRSWPRPWGTPSLTPTRAMASRPSAASSSRRTCSPPTSRGSQSSTPSRATSTSAAAPSSPMWSWATRSTGPLPRSRPPCWRRWPRSR